MTSSLTLATHLSALGTTAIRHARTLDSSLNLNIRGNLEDFRTHLGDIYDRSSGCTAKWEQVNLTFPAFVIPSTSWFDCILGHWPRRHQGPLRLRFPLHCRFARQDSQWYSLLV